MPPAPPAQPQPQELQPQPLIASSGLGVGYQESSGQGDDVVGELLHGDALKQLNRGKEFQFKADPTFYDHGPLLTSAAQELANTEAEAQAAAAPTPDERQTYTIEATAGPYGLIQPAGRVLVAHGVRASFEFDPEPGATLIDVVLDGISLASSKPGVRCPATYGFSPMGTNHQLHAVFLPPNLPEPEPAPPAAVAAPPPVAAASMDYLIRHSHRHNHAHHHGPVQHHHHHFHHGLPQAETTAAPMAEDTPPVPRLHHGLHRPAQPLSLPAAGPRLFRRETGGGLSGWLAKVSERTGQLRKRYFELRPADATLRFSSGWEGRAGLPWVGTRALADWLASAGLYEIGLAQLRSVGATAQDQGQAAGAIELEYLEHSSTGSAHDLRAGRPRWMRLVAPTAGPPTQHRSGGQVELLAEPHFASSPLTVAACLQPPPTTGSERSAGRWPSHGQSIRLRSSNHHRRGALSGPAIFEQQKKSTGGRGDSRSRPCGHRSGGSM